MAETRVHTHAFANTGAHLHGRTVVHARMHEQGVLWHARMHVRTRVFSCWLCQNSMRTGAHAGSAQGHELDPLDPVQHPVLSAVKGAPCADG
jgi:hypothetical protein